MIFFSTRPARINYSVSFFGNAQNRFFTTATRALQTKFFHGFFMGFFTRYLWGVLAFAAFARCEGGVVFQFIPKNIAATESNVVWISLGGARPPGEPQEDAPRLVADCAEWQDTGNGVANVAATPSMAGPMVFHHDDATNQWVKTLVFVLKTPQSGFSARETLVCGREGMFRLFGKNGAQKSAFDAGACAGWRDGA